MTADWFEAPALVQLRDEVDAKYPHRDKASDGTVGDTSHQAHVSDHNPCWACTGRSHGIVRALDLDSNGPLGVRTPLVDDVLAATIGDPRVWYVIWDGVIWSRTYAFVPHAYTGPSPHQEHVHISLNGANGVPGDPGNFDTHTWLDTPAPDPGHVGHALDHAIADVRKALRRHRAAGHTAIARALAADLAELKATRAKYGKR